MPAWLSGLWPVRSFVLSTPLSVREVEARLALALDPDRASLLQPPGSRPWIGRVGGGVLDMRRRISYRNSFLPRVFATFGPAPTGTTVQVRMTLAPFVLVFMTIWMGLACVGAAGGLLTAITRGDPRPLATLIFPAFGAGLVALGFGPEARRAEAFLRTALSAAAPSEGKPPC